MLCDNFNSLTVDNLFIFYFLKTFSKSKNVPQVRKSYSLITVIKEKYFINMEAVLFPFCSVSVKLM